MKCVCIFVRVSLLYLSIYSSETREEKKAYRIIDYKEKQNNIYRDNVN